MKSGIVLTIAAALLFLGPGSALSDEISDMQERIRQLEQTIEVLKQDLREMKEEKEGEPPEAEGPADLGEFGEIEEMPLEEEADAGEFGTPADTGEFGEAADAGEFGEPAEEVGEFGAPADTGEFGEAADAGEFGEPTDTGAFGEADAGEFGAEGEAGGGLDFDISLDEGEMMDVSELKEEPAPSGGGITSGLSFGGHLKLFLADRSEGERNGIDQNNNLSAGFHNFFFYISKTLNNWLMADVQTNIGVIAGATPRLGNDIDRDTSTSINTKITEAAITALLPYEAQLKVGVFDPIFSEEYAKQLWWHQQYHGNVGMLQVQEWHDVGAELYKNFDFSFMSLPTYFYLLNGDDSSTYESDTYVYKDNNGGMSGMIHIAPELVVGFLSRLQFMGSLGYGKWDDGDDKDAIKYALGVEMQLKNFTLSSEYMNKTFEDVPLDTGGVADGDEQGYYVKALYDITDKWRGVAKFSHAELYKADDVMLTDTYDSFSFGINYFITGSSTIMPQLSFTDADRSDGSETLEYYRFTLGWRTTF